MLWFGGCYWSRGQRVSLIACVGSGHEGGFGNVAPSIKRIVSLFFFSSRRRHTRCGRDWSSDVCSSDLYLGEVEEFDAAVLDLGLPVRDGLTVLRAWRAQGRVMPVMILTARGAWHEKVAGMDAGADDYLAKPFHMEELMARLRALLRRLSPHASAQWQCGPIVLDSRHARVSVAGQPLTLTSHEFKVLALLMQRVGQVISRTELSEHIYPQDSSVRDI